MRNPFGPTVSLQDQLAKEGREQAKRMPGREREELSRKASQADTAARIDEWVNSPGLQRPT
ncbi:hypothetical protein MTX25_18410 [Bradyrhizobium sp. ISRA432]|nr:MULTISPECIES: hypothetical protein [unclassified Bradyrhizobium]WGR74738.1 hypothetical protein MTX24_18730 [Bradyrhizobium sp. ISRA426]WGR79573.1 hypothetical protein MTX21_03845 [Bradyrhizobium sp. ISRA430]WGR89910.1 hypothetical protein MTX25_18410 [Bradyrhizobium sp. ISRA432]